MVVLITQNRELTADICVTQTFLAIFSQAEFVSNEMTFYDDEYYTQDELLPSAPADIPAIPSESQYVNHMFYPPNYFIPTPALTPTLSTQSELVTRTSTTTSNASMSPYSKPKNVSKKPRTMVLNDTEKNTTSAVEIELDSDQRWKCPKPYCQKVNLAITLILSDIQESKWSQVPSAQGQL
jgi:hypothetical protein